MTDRVLFIRILPAFGDQAFNRLDQLFRFAAKAQPHSINKAVVSFIFSTKNQELTDARLQTFATKLIDLLTCKIISVVILRCNYKKMKIIFTPINSNRPQQFEEVETYFNKMKVLTVVFLALELFVVITSRYFH